MGLVNLKEKLLEMDKVVRERFADPEWESTQARVAAAIAEDAKVQVEHRRRKAGIPALFRPFMDDPWASLVAAGHTQPADHRALDFVRDEWIPSGKPVAILAGEFGRGKSVAMCWVVDRDPLGGAYVQASDICRSGWYGDEYWDRWLRVSTLALDEVGMEPMDAAGWWEGKLHRLLSGRLEENRRTLIGMNLSRADLRSRYGSTAMKRTWDRLEAAWLGRVFVGPSLRKGGKP